MKNILLLNGSPSGELGNTHVLTEYVEKILHSKNVKLKTIYLKELLAQNISLNDIENHLKKADAFIFTSGTYWDSWGSPLQYFLETSTQFEGSNYFLGKPASVIITMHSVGGKGVLSRLQGVLNTLGISIPPMSGMVYSLANHLSLTSASDFHDDFWSTDDIETILHNLLASFQNKNYVSWKIDHKDPKRIWIK